MAVEAPVLIALEHGEETRINILRLQRQLSRVREERDILKKALAIFSERRP